MAHRGMTQAALRRLVAHAGGKDKHEPELSLLRAPCRLCGKTVSVAPQSTKERFGVRCLFCLGLFCIRCGTRHFERPRPRKIPKGRRRIHRYRAPLFPRIHASLARIEKKLKSLKK